MVTEAKKRAVRKYDLKNTVRFGLKLNIKTDHDIITRLEKVPNKQGYIKNLIRDDIRKESAP